MNSPQDPSVIPRTGSREFILLMAAMTALDAFSIDAMLPALSQIGMELGVTVENHRQRVITYFFLGFSFGVLVYGFAADQFGRRRPSLVGFGIFGLGSIICITAASFDILLIGRIMQGFGAAGPYVLSVTIVRDLYSGREMAQRLSLIMMVFIGVPMIAPFIGQGVLQIASWRGIFAVLVLFAACIAVWFSIRQVETLKPEHRQAISTRSICNAIRTVLTDPQTLRYLLALGAINGAFIAYLSTGQQVFQDIYLLGGKFPIVFATLASLFGVASYLNSRWVETIGSAKLVHYALSAIIMCSVIFLLTFRIGSEPPLWSYMLYMGVVMASFAFLFGNVMTLALEPMGHIAGSASSLVNSLSTMLAIPLASYIGAQLNSSVHPVVAGFAILCSIAWILNSQQIRRRRLAGIS